MINKITAVCVIGLVFGFAFGCASIEKGSANGDYLVFTDSEGCEIRLDERPEKVAVCFSSLAQMYADAGGEIYISVGENIERGFAKSDVLLVDEGAGKKIDTELLIGYEPDFVIFSADIPAQVEACEILREAGIPAACFRVDDFEDYLEVFETMCLITGDDKAFVVYGENVKNRIDDMLENIDKEKFARLDILFIRCGSGASSTKAKNSQDNFVCKMITELGAHNIADDVPVLLDGLSLESIIEADADYIFFSTMGDRDAAIDYMQSVLSQPGWSSLSAVKNNNYDFLPKELFQYKPNSNWDEAYEYLIELLEDGEKN